MISIIVLAHNRIELTAECLRSIRAAPCDEPLEVVCVDNASTDPFDGLVREFGGGERAVRFLRNDENLSFSAANNRAVAVAQGDTLLFINNDVIVGPGSIAALLRPLGIDDGVGVVGARLLFPGDDGVQHAGIGQMLWGYPSNYAVGAEPDDPRVTTQREMFAVTGALLGIRRDLFQEVGGFDEGFHWGYEDVDLCLKVRAAGRSVVYVPAAPSLHRESATLNERRSTAAEASNYDRYRAKWDHVLVAREQEYLERLNDANVRRVAVFGAGKAALGLWRVLTDNGIEVVAFTTTREAEVGRALCGRRVVGLSSLLSLSFDRLMIGSQFYFQVEAGVTRFDPTGMPLFPVVW